MPEQLTGDPTKKNVLAGLLLDGEAAPAGCSSLDWPSHPGRPCGRLVINARPVNVATVSRGSQSVMQQAHCKAWATSFDGLSLARLCWAKADCQPWGEAEPPMQARCTAHCKLALQLVGIKYSRQGPLCRVLYA